MPRTATTSETKTAPKKVARKRTPRKTTTAGKSTAATKRATLSKEGAKRKAPTSITSTKSKAPRQVPKLLIACFVFLLLIVGGSVALGISDHGAINVASVVEEQNAKIVEEGGQPVKVNSISVPVDDVTPPPNGGLRPKGKSSTPAPAPTPEPIASSTASTTEATASSTDATAEVDTAPSEQLDTIETASSTNENTEA